MINPLSYKTFRLATAGLMATLAFEPFGLSIFLLPAFLILLDNVYRKSAKQAFFSGLVFGFFHFISSLYWIGIALTSNVGNFLWLMPFVIVLIPALLGIYTGIVCLIANFCGTTRIWFYFSFSFTWVFIEYIRGYVPVPFPWNFMGYSLASNNYTIYLAPFLGVHLSSLLIVLLSTLLFTRKLFLIISIYTLFTLGVILLEQHYGSKPIEFWPEKIRIVQPNLSEHHLGNPVRQLEAFTTLAELSLINNPSDLKAVIWPEAAYPYLFHDDDIELYTLSTIAPKNGYLITGVDRIDDDRHIYNSIIAISSDAKIVSTYDKYTLVPFGEYVPLRKILAFVDKIAYGVGEFTPGNIYTGAHSDELALNYYPLICYEAIFPISQDLTRYSWLLNVTNDAWFGISSGPYQHLAMARFSAAEYGMPLIRVANTGVSAIISPYGKILEKIDLNTRAFLDVHIPKKNEPSYTIFRDNQILLISICFFVCLFSNLALKIIPMFKKRAK